GRSPRGPPARVKTQFIASQYDRPRVGAAIGGKLNFAFKKTDLDRNSRERKSFFPRAGTLLEKDLPRTTVHRYSYRNIFHQRSMPPDWRRPNGKEGDA